MTYLYLGHAFPHLDAHGSCQCGCADCVLVFEPGRYDLALTVDSAERAVYTFTAMGGLPQ